MSTARTLELLAPAKDLETGRIAIDCGADAVYIGARAFGARASAGNSTGDIAALADYAHRFGARVYVTMNTIIEESELSQARQLALDLADAGVDALIVQDMAYTQMNLPIPLHASTQCDIRTSAKATWLAKAGFTQLVLPREFTVDEIREVVRTAGAPVEVFIHGARCVSYSGDCQMGFAATGRSANRGMCPQMCRLPFDLIDGDGRPLGPRRYYLSLSDLRTPSLEALVDAGVSSFKIEGRLKDWRYVANAVAWYSAELNRIVEQGGGRYVRASFGQACPGFVPDIDKGFFRRPNGGGQQACLASPNDTGIAIGRVTELSTRARSFKIAGSRLANGDGIGYFDAQANEFRGFRLNRVEAENCYPAQPVSGIRPGTTLYRTFDKQFADTLESARPKRTVKVDFRLTKTDTGFCLMAESENGEIAEVLVNDNSDKALKDQTEQRKTILSKLGNTIFRLGSITDELGMMFVPASVLAENRRRVLGLLEQKIILAYKRPEPGVCILRDDEFSSGSALTYHDNIANSLSRKFYTSHGATISEGAVECGAPSQCDGRRVMATKYCIRRELGACLKTAGAKKFPCDMYLRNESGTYRLDFDCKRCGMDIIKLSKQL